MADFIIVIVTAAMLAAPTPAPTLAPGATVPGTAAAVSVPLSAPTVGFRTYPDAASCEQATAVLVAPPNARLVCVPVEPLAGDLTSAY